MAERDIEQLGSGIREDGGRAMRAPTAEDLEAVYWLDEGLEYLREGDDGAYFVEGTPQRILDSHALWKSRQSARVISMLKTHDPMPD